MVVMFCISQKKSDTGKILKLPSVYYWALKG